MGSIIDKISLATEQNNNKYSMISAQQSGLKVQEFEET